MEMLISFSSRTWHLPTLPEVPKADQWTWCNCAWLASKLAWPEPHRESGVLMRDIRPNNADDLKSTIKSTLASITPDQCHGLIASMPRCINAVIYAKGVPTKYWVHRNEHTFQKPDIFVQNILCFNLCYMLIFRDTECWVFIICLP